MKAETEEEEGGGIQGKEERKWENEVRGGGV